MLDFAILFDSATGLVAGSDVVPPSKDGDPWWRVTAALSCGHDGAAASFDATELPRCTAGACASTRAGAMVRAAGEAVERMALHGAADHVATAASLGDKALRFWADDIDLAADPGEQVLRWYSSTRVVDNQVRFVPAGLVDFPAAQEDRIGFDPGPSGAAAGLGYDDALRRALLETVERDAVIVSWARQQRLIRVDVEEALAAAQWDQEWQNLKRALEVAKKANMEPTFAQIPLGIDGLVCVVGGVRSPGTHHLLVSLGAKVSSHPATALGSALQESFQLITGLRVFESTEAHNSAVADETERIRFFSSPIGVTALENWLADPIESAYPTIPSGLDGSIDDLIAAVVADGLDPYVVDLTSTLPDPVRGAGWSVVKVVPVGYQPLRIDERCEFGWNRHRLGSLEVRTGVEARRPSDRPHRLPHPLP